MTTNHSLNWTQLESALDAAVLRDELPAASLPYLTSTLKSTLRQMAESGLLGHKVNDFEAENLQPLLPIAAGFAFEAAKRKGHSRPGNTKARVVQSLEAIQPGVTTAKVTMEARIERAGEAWQPLFTAIVGMKHYRLHRCYLLMLAERAIANGTLSPAALPVDSDDAAVKMRNWLLEEGEINKIIYCYRIAMREMLAKGLSIPGAPSWHNHRKAGKTIHRIGGLAGDPEARLQECLPKFATLLDSWQKSPRTNVTPSTANTYADSMYRVAQGLLMMWEDGKLPIARLQDLSPHELWSTRLQSLRMPTVENSNEKSLLADFVGQASAERAMLAASQLPLAAVLGEWQAMHQGVRTRSKPSSTKFFVPRAVSDDISNVWCMLRSFLEHKINADGEPDTVTRFERLCVVAGEAEAYFTALFAKARPKKLKDKERAVRHITLPIMVCAVLPWWTQIALPRAKRRADEAVRGQRKERDGGLNRSALTAVRKYANKLQSWTLLAVAVADPMRRAQECDGRLGVEYRLSADWNDDGSLRRILSLESRFSGAGEPDNPAAGIKQGHVSLREWQLAASIVDFAWLAEYLRVSWLPMLVATGNTPADTTLRDAVQSGRFSLFPSPRAKHARPAQGAYSPAGLSGRFASAMRDSLLALGYDVPKKENRVAEGWGMILGPHIVRLLWATYWLGLREHVPIRFVMPDGTSIEISCVELVKRATTDAENTLRWHYSAVSSEMEKLEREAGSTWRHPRIYDRWMDATYFPTNPVDWATVWANPDFPLPTGIRGEFEDEVRRRADG